MRFKPPLTPKPLIFIFSLIILSAFLILSVTWFFTEKSTKDYSISLQKFKSDFKNKDQKKALFKDEIFKMNRFIAFGSYITVPEGIYRADFYIQSKSDLEVTLVLQMVSHKGKTIDLSKKSNIKHFPSKHSVHFKVFSHKEVEPRVLYVSGNRDIQLKKVEINKLKGIFPWKRLLYKSMFFGFFFSLILFAFFHTFENAIRWNFFLNLFFLLMGFFFILRTTWVSEDAFIILRHVDNFLAGLGPVFNAGERVEGYTSPLWFYIVSLFRWAGFSPKGALVFPSLMISFTALYILIFKITFSHDTTKRLHLNPGVAILIGTSAFIDFGTSGLETSLTYLLLIIYAKLIAEEKWLTYPTLMGLVVTLLVFTRPDFGILLIFMMGFYLFQLWGKKVKPRQFFLFLTFPLSLLGGYQLFRMGFYATFFPNPFYAKSGAGSHFSQGINYLIDFFQGSLVSVLLLIVILGIVLSFRQRELRKRLIILFSGLIHGFFVIRGGGDFMHGRFLLPAFILITISISGAFDHFFNKKISLKNSYIALSLILLYISIHTLPVQKRGKTYNFGISNERYFYYQDEKIPLKYIFKDTVIIMWKTIGQNYRELAHKARLNIRTAYKNVGFTGYYAGRHIYLIDRLGLTDPVVSRIKIKKRSRPGHEKHAHFGYLILKKLTFGNTPYPLWNRIAETTFGVLWDVSPRTLQKLKFILPADFKKDINNYIIDFLNHIDEKKIKEQADFLFFLKQFWYPHTSSEYQLFFNKVYREDIIYKNASSYLWIQKNRKNYQKLMSHIRGKLTVKQFFKNIIFALTEGRHITFSQN